MQRPYVVTLEAVLAYEKASGFHGIGRFLEGKGLLTIRSQESREENA